MKNKKLLVFYKMPDFQEDTLRIIESTNQDTTFAEPTAFGVVTEDVENDDFEISLYPALYEEHFANLIGRVTSIIDATYSNTEQRDAVKKLIKDNMNTWYKDNLKHAYKRANNAKYNTKILPFEP
jgi:Neuraminidase (sialidase)